MNLLSRWLHRTAPPAPSRRRSRPELEPLEERTLLATGLYAIDGTGNNLTNPAWGSAGTDLLRLAAAAYADGVSTPAGTDRPSARLISDTVADQGSVDIISDRALSAMIYAW